MSGSYVTDVCDLRDLLGPFPCPLHIARLLAEPTNVDLWAEMIPPDAFEFDGMTMITPVEVTAHEVISRLKNDPSGF